MSESITLARPYAKAAFDFAKSESDVKQWANNLLVAAGLAQDEQLLNFFNRPDVVIEDLVLFIAGDDANENYKNFVRLLAENDRLSLLPEVAQLYEYYSELDSQSLTVDVVSAIELSDAQKKAMVAALSKRTGKQVTLKTKVDPDLVGGAVIHCGDLVIDGSLRGKVNRLKSQLSA